MAQNRFDRPKISQIRNHIEKQLYTIHALNKKYGVLIILQYKFGLHGVPITNSVIL